jgi:hypothetical protein
MRYLLPFTLALPFFLACNPSGVEDASGEEVVVDNTENIETVDKSQLETMVGQLKEAGCAMPAGSTQEDRQGNADMMKLLKDIKDEAGKDMPAEEVQTLLTEQVQPAFMGTNCGA